MEDYLHLDCAGFVADVADFFSTGALHHSLGNIFLTTTCMHLKDKTHSAFQMIYTNEILTYKNRPGSCTCE